jgi:hypothetical protein
MKVFLSWSGEASHQVACVLKEWLPSVIQSLRPYVSSQDIDKGARWSTDIAKELQESTFGILCVTKSNIDAPWINFEAGALSKTIDKALVAPFLFDIKRSEVQGPLLQFQSTINDKVDVLKLLVSLNGAMNDNERLDEASLKKSFEVWWPELEKALNAVPEVEEKTKAPEKGSKFAQTEAILEEILELARSQQRILRSPQELLPRDYLDYVLRHTVRDSPQLNDALHVISRTRSQLVHYLSKLETLDGTDPAAQREMNKAIAAELAESITLTEMVLTDLDRSALLRSRPTPPRVARQPQAVRNPEIISK